ncbi:hypothetical protein D9611_002232 [Ephemerocybe angulata]|uniref:Transcription regulator Rua1 C-terminal domain-containing protein n=1 Tax=Ephemerocybe angulata TaxID=980116 RepID=A0A8H5C1W2_9AGAR|nr:hypothetical protein D9611_002232 [Tulosesus angulatus]
MLPTNSNLLTEVANLSYSPAGLSNWPHWSPGTPSRPSPRTEEHSRELEAYRLAYDLNAQRILNNTHESSPVTRISSPYLSKILLGDSTTARLPILRYTPPHVLPSLALSETSDTGSQSPCPLTLSSPSFGSASFSSQDSYDLNTSPLAAIFNFRVPSGSFESEVSPVIRSTQAEPGDMPASVGQDEFPRSAGYPKLKTKSRSTFVESLVSSADSLGAEDPGSSHLDSAHVLRSPCKLSGSRQAYEEFSLAKPKSKGSPAGHHAPTCASKQGQPTSAATGLYGRQLRSSAPKRKLEVPAAALPSKRLRLVVKSPDLEKKETENPLVPGSSTTQQATERPTYTSRVFPDSVEISPFFGLFYRRFPASSYFYAAGERSPCSLFKVCNPGGTYNPPRSALDIYTPRDFPGIHYYSTNVVLNSYHMQYFHGISAASGRPFSPPLSFRVVPRSNPAKLERKEMRQGKCHKCSKWIDLEGVKDVESKVKELFWFVFQIKFRLHGLT